MRKSFKILAIFFGLFLGLLILLSAGFLVVLSHFIKPDTLKALLIKQTAAQTHRQLTIGKLDWSLFPTVGITLNDVALSNPNTFPDAPFLAINQINIGVKLSPLFHHRFEAASINVRGVDLALIKSKTGIINWNNALPYHFKIHTADSSASKPNGTMNYLSLNQVSIPSIDIDDINVTYLNQQTNQNISINHFNFHAQNIQNAKAFPFNLGLSFTQNDPAQTIQLQMHGNMQVQAHTLQLANTALEIDLAHHQKLVASNLATQIISTNDALLIEPFNMNLYGGLLHAQASFNFKSNVDNLNLNVTHLDAGALLMDVAGDDQFTGIGDIQINLSSATPDSSQMINHLNGAGYFHFIQSQYLGVNLGYLYRNAMSLLLRGKFIFSSHDSFTQLGDLTDNFIIQAGVLNTANLRYVSPVLHVEGSGNANLNTQALDMHLIITGKHGTPLPFNVKGTLGEPKVSADLAAILDNQLKNDIASPIEKTLSHIHLMSLF